MLRTVLLLCLISGSLGQNTCTISVKNATLPSSLPSPSPLLLKPGGTHDVFGFLLPADSKGIVTMRTGEKVLLACPGPQNYLVPLQPLPVKKTSQLIHEAVVTCVAGNNFMVNNRTFTFKQLACSSYPFHLARKSSNNCNNDKGVKIGVMLEIGFEVTAGFYKLIDICFDETLKNAIYSRLDLVSSIGGSQTGNYRPAVYLQGKPPFYPGLIPENLYKQSRENANISHLLSGNNHLNNRLIRGHLTAGLDFVYKSQKRTAFYYANVVPQWETFKDKNWNTLEADIRNFAAEKKLNLEVYTGTHGILTLPDGKELYLSDNGPRERFIPVPKLVWKVVYDPKSRAGVAIVSVNHPYVRTGQAGQLDHICPNMSSNVTWVKWNLAKPEFGYGYCCDVNRFKQAVNVLPSTVLVDKLLV